MRPSFLFAISALALAACAQHADRASTHGIVLTGLSAAYDGYRASLQGKSGPVVQGFSADQQFFIAFAQPWAAKMRPAALRKRVLTDSHAPAEYRVATVRNLDEW